MKIKNEHKKQLKSEILYIAAAYAILFIILKIVFTRNSAYNLVKILAFFALVNLPFFLLLLTYKEIKFFERFMLSIAIGFAVLGTASYNLGLLGVHAKYHLAIIILFVLALGGYVNFLKRR